MTHNASGVPDREKHHRLHIAGDVDLYTAPHIEQDGLHALSNPAVLTLALDLRDVTFIDSTGIGSLIRLRLAAEEKQKDLVLTEPSEPVLRVLALTALTTAFNIDTGPEAQQRLSPT